MNNMKGFKTFLLCTEIGLNQEHGCRTVFPRHIVIADSFKSAAETVGGKFEERAERPGLRTVVVFPKSLFKEVKGSAYLEYRLGGLVLCIFPEEKEAVVEIMEVSFTEQAFIEPLKTQ